MINFLYDFFFSSTTRRTEAPSAKFMFFAPRSAFYLVFRKITRVIVAKSGVGRFGVRGEQIHIEKNVITSASAFVYDFRISDSPKSTAQGTRVLTRLVLVRLVDKSADPLFHCLG